MELLKIITHAFGGDGYVDNATDYLFDGRCNIRHGYGINPNSHVSAGMQFKQTAKFWNNQDKNPFIHCMLSFSPETAPDPEIAMKLTAEIIEPLTDEHLALSGAHDEKRTGSIYHTHTFISTTNINNGTMMYPDNKTNYALAQRAADVTGQPVKLVVDNGKRDDDGWECPKTFYPHKED